MKQPNDANNQANPSGEPLGYGVLVSDFSFSEFS